MSNDELDYKREWRIKAGRTDTYVPKDIRCKHPNLMFDRSVCFHCKAMHYYCQDCTWMEACQ